MHTCRIRYFITFSKLLTIWRQYIKAETIPLNFMFYQPNNPTNLPSQLQTNLLNFELLQNHQTLQSHSFINISISPVKIFWLLQSAYNSIYSTICILVHNLITYTNLRTDLLQPEKTSPPWPNTYLKSLRRNPTEEPATTAMFK